MIFRIGLTFTGPSTLDPQILPLQLDVQLVLRDLFRQVRRETPQVLVHVLPEVLHVVEVVDEVLVRLDNVVKLLVGDEEKGLTRKLLRREEPRLGGE